VVQDATVTADPSVERVRAAYEAVHARLWRAVLAYSGSREIADDAVAEAWAQVLRRGDAVEDPGAWAWRAAFRIAAGDLQRRRAEPAAVDDARSLELPEPALDLVAALGRLSDQQRACVVLCDLADHTAVDAARLLGTTAATVRVQRMRARRRLRVLLADHEEADRV
jgi:RNA polymerase sigma-70 factor (ECF subfamily)